MKNIQMAALLALVIIITISAIWVATTPCCEGGKTSTGVETIINESSQPVASMNRVELYHFHGDHQCYSCITVGDFAEETVNEYFQNELDSGQLIFAHVNYDLDENEDLAEKYGVTGSSLWIGVYDEDGFHKENNVNVWYKINDKEAYKEYLKEIIDKRLAGDLS